MESAYKFPEEISLRVIGESSLELPAKIIEIVKQFAPDASIHNASGHTSQSGKYSSTIIHFTAQNKAQLDAIHAALIKVPGVKMVI